MTINTSPISSKSLAFGALILSAGTIFTSPVNAASSNISASATVVSPITVSERSDIRLSGFVPGATPKTVTLQVPPALPDVSPTSLTPMKSAVGFVQIGGLASSSFSGVTTEPTTTLTSGNNNMTLGNIKLRYGANGTAGAVSGPGMLNSDGQGSIMIGGVLAVAAGQAAGNYVGTLTVSIDY